MPKTVERTQHGGRAADIVRDAGGTIVGRTRLQKIAYLLELAGMGQGFRFGYKHYGPYSEDLAAAVRHESLLGLLEEKETPTNWGGFYSTFRVPDAGRSAAQGARYQLVAEGSRADPVELELAATAAFLAAEGHSDPWAETAKRKPEKAAGDRLGNAKALYARLAQVNTPKPLPQLPR